MTVGRAAQAAKRAGVGERPPSIAHRAAEGGLRLPEHVNSGRTMGSRRPRERDLCAGGASGRQQPEQQEVLGPGLRALARMAVGVYLREVATLAVPGPGARNSNRSGDNPRAPQSEAVAE